MNKRNIVTLCLSLTALILVFLSIHTSSYMWEGKPQVNENSSTIKISLCIDYGNGTREWFNQTIPRGYSLLNATKLVAEVDYTYQPAYKASFVNAINDLPNKPPYFWMWYRWDPQENEWKLGPVGADIYRLKSDEIVMWRYEKPSMHR